MYMVLGLSLWTLLVCFFAHGIPISIFYDVFIHSVFFFLAPTPLPLLNHTLYFVILTTSLYYDKPLSYCFIWL